MTYILCTAGSCTLNVLKDGKVWKINTLESIRIQVQLQTYTILVILSWKLILAIPISIIFLQLEHWSQNALWGFMIIFWAIESWKPLSEFHL